MEVVCQIILSTDLGLTSVDDKNEILPKAEILARQLSAYRKSLYKQLNSKPSTLNPQP